MTLNLLSLLWITFLALFVSLTSVGVEASLPGKTFQILFIPVTIYLIYTLFRQWLTKTPAFQFQGIWLRILVYYCFIVAETLVAVSFISAHTPPEIISSIIFLPLGIYFFWLIWPRHNRALPLATVPITKPTPTPHAQINLDLDRRDFLKLLGTAGISIFLYNLLFKRNTTPMFLNNTPSPTPLGLKNAQGEVINPAEKSPTQGYYISQIDDSAISYYGFINHLGQWFIMRQDLDNSYRYIKGDKDFASNWSNRSQLTYDYFDNVF